MPESPDRRDRKREDLEGSDQNRGDVEQLEDLEVSDEERGRVRSGDVVGGRTQSADRDNV